MTYIILNKLWFYEVYSVINQLKSANHMHLQDIWDENRYVWDKKLIDFITNPLAYIAIVCLMASFIAYTVGTYPLDYDSTEYEVASSARESIYILGFCFIGFFLLSNLQAAIVFTIIVLVIVVLILCGVILLLCALPILCVIYSVITNVAKNMAHSYSKSLQTNDPTPLLYVITFLSI